MFDRIHEIVSLETSDLKKLARAAGADFKVFYIDADLSGVDLRGQDLTEFDLSGADLSDAIIDETTRLPSNVGISRSPRWKDQPDDLQQFVVSLFVSSSHEGMTVIELERLKTMSAAEVRRLISVGRDTMGVLVDKYLADFYARRRISSSIKLPNSEIAFLNAEKDRFSMSTVLGFVPSRRIYLSALLNVGIDRQRIRPLELDADPLDH